MDLDGFTSYYQKAIYPKCNRIYVIGDIHGDLKAFIYSLRLANVIDKNLDWNGGSAHVIQIGDVFDRKSRLGDQIQNDEDSEFKICALMLKLQYQSYQAGGGFHCIIGNHELMNVMGIHDYVSTEGKNHFLRNRMDRTTYLQPGSPFAKYMACTWNPIVKIGDWIFCHGGISPKIAKKYSVDDVNLLMRDYLYGNKSHQKKPYFHDLFLGSHSVLWNRDYSTHSNHRSKAEESLRALNAKHMVVGHTIQSNGIMSRYDGSIWNVDTGMSEAFGLRKNPKERVQILFVEKNENAKILKY